jgi:hypothetical protein
MNADVAKEYWATMNHEEKLGFVVANGTAASFAYNRLHLHRDAAHRQMARIGEAIRDSKPTLPEPKIADLAQTREYMRDGVRRMRPVLSEVHFYFVAWANCRNMLQVLTGQPEFLEAKKIFDSYLKHFEHYVAGRNSFEHFHERLAGQKDEDRVKEVRDFGASARRIYAGFRDGRYIHSDQSWDISPDSLKLLDQAIQETLAVVHLKIDELYKTKGNEQSER